MRTIFIKHKRIFYSRNEFVKSMYFFSVQQESTSSFGCQVSRPFAKEWAATLIDLPAAPLPARRQFSKSRGALARGLAIRQRARLVSNIHEGADKSIKLRSDQPPTGGPSDPSKYADPSGIRGLRRNPLCRISGISITPRRGERRIK